MIFSEIDIERQRQKALDIMEHRHNIELRASLVAWDLGVKNGNDNRPANKVRRLSGTRNSL